MDGFRGRTSIEPRHDPVYACAFGPIVAIVADHFYCNFVSIKFKNIYSYLVYCRNNAFRIYGSAPSSTRKSHHSFEP